jgi:hypothetical protein
LCDKARALTGRQVLIGAATAGEQALTELATTDPKIVVQCLPGPFGKLEANGPPGLALANIGAVKCVAVGRDVIDAKRDEIAAPKLAIDCEIEERQIPHAPLQLQLGPYGPDMAYLPWRLWASEHALNTGRPA